MKKCKAIRGKVVGVILVSKYMIKKWGFNVAIEKQLIKIKKKTMNGRMALRLKKEARKECMDGSEIISVRYDQKKKAYKTHSQNPKLKESRREKRR